MFKKIQRVISISAFMFLPILSMAASPMESEFEKAWTNPSYTHIELTPLDVNHILSTYYTTEPKLTFTRSMLWEVERKKAWNPEVYIASVIEKGSGKSWQKQALKDGNEVFVRSTKQRQWLHSDRYGEVFEKVFLNNKEQKVTFIGVSELTDESGARLYTKNPQPLFHVEHGVAGTDSRPLNTWRIVHLTKDSTGKLAQVLNQGDKTVLPSYIIHYIEHDLGVKLKRK